MKTPTTKKTVKVSKAEQRVIIAKDALAQLNQEKFVAFSGVYVGFELMAWLDEESNGNDKLQAKSFLKKKECSECRVCAKGALFLSAIRKYNKATIEDIARDDMKVAEKIFGEEHFDQIEAAFELWETTKTDPSEEGVPSLEACAFGMAYDDDNDRLEAILKNIIRNKGTFKP